VIDEDGDTLDIYYHEFDLDQYLRDVRRYTGGDTSLVPADFEPSGNMYRIRYADMWYPGDRYFRYYFRPYWGSRNTTHYSADLALTSQVNKSNQLKAGAFVRKHFLDLTEVQFVNDNPYTDAYEKEPIVAAAYIQDKIEHEELTVNAGVRLDYFDPQSKFFVNYQDLDEGQDWVVPKWQVSPRLGISFAVSEKAIMYASYGHFFQPIDLGDLYQNLEADITSGLPLIGNPDLPPQKEVMYETGFRYAFNRDLAFEVTAYYKDVKTLLSSQQVNTIWQGSLASYTIFELEDFAILKGVDFILQKRAFEYLSGSLSYSYLDAKGTGSFGSEFYYRYLRREVELPRREYPLEFDVTHTVKADLNFYCPKGFGPTVFNFKPFQDLNTSVQFTFASGAPYTPTDARDNPMEVGSKRMQSSHWVDTKIDKRFEIGGLGLHLFTEITNLLNKRNIVDIWTHTGKPDDDGRYPDWDPAAYSSYEDYDYESAEEWYEDQIEKWKLYVTDPTNYADPRKIRFGIAAEF
jgi:outer membrane receptor for ferrienterochelin and colicin